MRFRPRATLDGAVDLVSRHVQEPVHAMPQRGIEHGLSACDICEDEICCTGDRPIDMRFRREVDDGVHVVHQRVDELNVEDVTFDECKARVFSNRVEVGQVAGVGELVENDDRGVRKRRIAAGEQSPHEVRADEACAPGHENLHAPSGFPV